MITALPPRAFVGRGVGVGVAVRVGVEVGVTVGVLVGVAVIVAVAVGVAVAVNVGRGVAVAVAATLSANTSSTVGLARGWLSEASAAPWTTTSATASSRTSRMSARGLSPTQSLFELGEGSAQAQALLSRSEVGPGALQHAANHVRAAA